MTDTDLFDPLAAPLRLDGSNGEAVVLVHGFTGTPGHFRPMAAELHERGYTVNVPLLAGHGTSIDDLGTTGPRDWIESVRSGVAAVGDHRCIHLVGLSMGGLLSLIVASSFEVATVTTIDSPILTRDKKSYLAPILKYFIPKVEWPDNGPPDLDPEMMPYWLAYSGFPMSAAAGLVSIIARVVWAARKVSAPALVIQSLTDEAVDPRSAKLLARLLGDDTDLVWLDNSLHNAILDRERHKILDAILNHLA